MASTECKISKLGAAVITRDITLTIPGKCEIFRKPGSATSHSVIMAAKNTGLLTVYGVKKHKKKITIKNFVQ
jgi:hypothetical protein